MAAMIDLVKTRIIYRNRQKVDLWLTGDDQKTIALGFGRGVDAMSVTTYSVKFGVATANNAQTTIEMDKIVSVRGVSSRSVRVR